MAHRIKIVERPYIKADGTKSATKVLYDVVDKTRGRLVVVGTTTNKADAVSIRDAYRESLYERHIAAHPTDEMFVKKNQERRKKGSFG